MAAMRKRRLKAGVATQTGVSAGRCCSSWALAAVGAAEKQFCISQGHRIQMAAEKARHGGSRA